MSVGRRSRDWDATTYDRISALQQTWAAEQLSRLALRGDEVVLDAGCGSGKITAVLADLVPRGRVYAVDAAPSMAAHTERALRTRAIVSCQDLAQLTLPEAVDVIFSNATFHWIGDHGRLFSRLCSALGPGGRLLAQCGGRGNIDAFRTLADEVAAQAPFAPYFSDWQRPWTYASPEETAARLIRAGFTDVSCALTPRQVTLTEPRPFIRTVCLVRHLDPLPEELRERFLEEVLARTGQPLVLDYVRLNMVARRAD